MEISFGTMLQGAAAGKQMVEDLQAFAAVTPLDSASLQAATKTLLQFGTAGQDIMPTLKQLGDVTGGDAGKLQSMALAFGQMSSSGRLMGQDLLQMINVGFNPLQEIARTSGKSVAFLKQEMEQGRISVQMVKNALKSATSEGGNFVGLMEKQSKSVSGLFSTMGDDISGFLHSVGKDLIHLLKLNDIMQAISTAAQAATTWLAGVSPEVKRIAAVVGMVVVGVGALAAAWPLIAAVAGPALAGIIGTLELNPDADRCPGGRHRQCWPASGLIAPAAWLPRGRSSRARRQRPGIT